ncbi:hypothetical protein F2Q69_00054194 [Brassica cretica]|uniref:Uncharacterized protein n=1 Tax=Brassica cretica TaxID=69181 RepID=A0A8S9N1V5_BRACR|nr:hypothetical protein F2Q69_00054194 [Brassica cretica]
MNLLGVEPKTKIIAGSKWRSKRRQTTTLLTSSPPASVVSPSEDQSKPPWTATVSVLMVSPPVSLVFSVRNRSKPTTASLVFSSRRLSSSLHGVSSSDDSIMKLKSHEDTLKRLGNLHLSIAVYVVTKLVRFITVCVDCLRDFFVTSLVEMEDLWLFMDSSCLTLFELSTEAPPPISSRSNHYKRLSRPPGVKAAKGASGKRSIADHQAVSEFQTMWSIKEKDLAVKERLSKMGLLGSLISKKRPTI